MTERSQIWEGWFAYELVNYLGEIKKVKISFLMTIEIENGIIRGNRIDDETKGLITESITVQGFIDGNFINFIVNYPYYYWVDEETQEVIVEKSEKHPGVSYSGTFDKAENSCEGVWSLVAEEFQEHPLQPETTEATYDGTWAMTLIS